jgi:spore germination protein KA
MNNTEFSKDIHANIAAMRAFMNNTSDLIVNFAEAGGQIIALLTCENMVSADTLSVMVFEPLRRIEGALSPEELGKAIADRLLLAVAQNTANNPEEAAKFVMSGFAVILVNGMDQAYAIGAQGYMSRGVEQAQTNMNLRSSRESFNEVIRVNMSLIRRRLKTPNLVFEMMNIGEVSKTDVCMCYIKGTADPIMVKQIRERLNNIKLPIILDGGFLHPFLEERQNNLFTEVGTTERPDTMAAKLAEGRVGVLVDGTPFSLYLPCLFVENFHTMDDYTGQPLYMSVMRVLKYLAFFFTILLPGFYVALADFHPELFPNKLLFNLAASVQTTPYPLLVECVIIHVIYEIMREAGVRLPTYVGHAVSIVGGLVMGQIVVSAGLVGAPLVLIVGVAAISSFVVPNLYESIVILRFLFIFVGGFMGLFGLTLAGLILLAKMASMSAYGVPFTAPIAPFTLSAMRDVFFRLSWRKMGKKTFNISELNDSKK